MINFRTTRCASKSMECHDVSLRNRSIGTFQPVPAQEWVVRNFFFFFKILRQRKQRQVFGCTKSTAACAPWCTQLYREILNFLLNYYWAEARTVDCLRQGVTHYSLHYWCIFWNHEAHFKYVKVDNGLNLVVFTLVNMFVKGYSVTV